MDNPWVKLPLSPPFFLPEETQVIEDFNTYSLDKHRIRPELIPEPYLGDINAPIVLLSLNPGFSDGDIAFHNQDQYFIRGCRGNLLHEHSEYPFYLLDPKVSQSPGHRWWIKRLRDPITAAGLKTVSNKLFCVEYFPYHSKRYRSIGRILESQRYSFHLVVKALHRNSLVVIMRSRRLWMEAVPELASYPRLFQLLDNRRVEISQNNCPDGYHEVMRILMNDSP